MVSSAPQGSPLWQICEDDERVSNSACDINSPIPTGAVILLAQNTAKINKIKVDLVRETLMEIPIF